MTVDFLQQRILVHDLCGHPFQLELSKEFARRGHQVLHVYSQQFTTGKGDLTVPSTLIDRLTIAGAASGRRFAKYNIAARVLSEVRYGRSVASLADDFAPDVALTANDPLLAKQLIGRSLVKADVRWVVWEQDLLYKVVHRVRPAGLPAGPALAAVARRLEQRALRLADQVICITPDFVEELAAIGVERSKLSVIENWAPLDEIRPLDRPTPWQVEQGLDGRRLLVYSGTLGMKHDPGLLVSLAERLRLEHPDTSVIVVSEGLGADHLQGEIVARQLTNLRVLPFQPYARLSEVLSSATGLIVLLEPDAGPMSVPSKVLSYLAAGRPILGSLPVANAAHRQLADSGVGYLAPAGSPELFIDAALKLLTSEQLEVQGHQARRFAEQRFGVQAIADRFEQILFPN